MRLDPRRVGYDKDVMIFGTDELSTDTILLIV